MREIRVAKMIINCCVGESGDRLTKAAKVLEQLTSDAASTDHQDLGSLHLRKGFVAKRGAEVGVAVSHVHFFQGAFTQQEDVIWRE